MALALAIQHWRPYLLGELYMPTKKGPRHLLEQCVTTMNQQNWFGKLMGYQLTLCYKLGKDNLAANALSHIYEAAAELSTMITISQCLDGNTLTDGVDSEP